MTNTPFLLERPAQRTSCVVFASPHSGRTYPADMTARTVLDPLTLRSSEDAFVDELYADVPRFGAAFLMATYPRAYVDLNRCSSELDPALIEGVDKRGLTPRIVSGLGVIPRVVSGGRCIYQGKISRTEAQVRLEQVWMPYHAALDALMEEARAQFGQAVLIDCHSMPRDAIGSTCGRLDRWPDIVIGDRYGASASANIVIAIERAFRAQGFKVARNVPFAGAHVVERYGRPARHCHAVQVEIDRSLYMDEASVTRRSDFAEVKARVAAAAHQIAQIGAAKMPLAAE